MYMHEHKPAWVTVVNYLDKVKLCNTRTGKTAVLKVHWNSDKYATVVITNVEIMTFRAGLDTEVLFALIMSIMR